MKKPSASYFELIDQSYDLVVKGFEVIDNHLNFQDINMLDLVQQYGSPLKISYLPKISSQIKRSLDNFEKAFKNHAYQGSYMFCYCTKSSHFSFVLDTVLKEGSQLEISSAYDIKIIRNLWKEGKVSKEHTIISNGYKSDFYVKEITDLWKDGFENIILVVDNADEIGLISDQITTGTIKIGLRIATEEEPKFEMYTSRL